MSSDLNIKKSLVTYMLPELKNPLSSIVITSPSSYSSTAPVVLMKLKKVCIFIVLGTTYL